jgi:uncharacterized HhH-GPD family protein
VVDVALHLTGDADADALLSRDPFALLIGALLDQQVPMETAFAGPAKIADRMGGLSVRAVAAASPDELSALFAQPPAVHRFPGSMAQRVQALAQLLVERYDGDASRLWTAVDESGGTPDAKTVLARLEALPGFGAQKSRIFLALLGKQYGVEPDGWREVAGPYGEPGARRSVADVVDETSLQEVRATKQAVKAEAAAKRKAR